MNLSGDNVLGSAVVAGITVGSTLQLGDVTGIGVEALGPGPVSNLTITAAIADAQRHSGRHQQIRFADADLARTGVV